MQLSKLKDIVWDACSVYVRQNSADSEGNATCYTCGKVAPWKKLQAGHGIGGRNNAVLFNLKLLRVQCWPCNGILHGNYTIFTRKLIEEYGLEEYKELERQARIPKTYTEQELWNLLANFSPMSLKELAKREARKLRTKAANMRKQADKLDREADSLESKAK